MLKEVLKSDHERLLKLLNDCLSDNSAESLIVFIRNARRHMELENEVIYKLSDNKELTIMNKKILGDHTRFLKVLNAAEAVDIRVVDIDSLKKLHGPFKGHNEYEDIYFYPILEKILSEEEIADLIDKVKDEVNFS